MSAPLALELALGLGSCQHAACCHGNQRVRQAGCPGNADAGGVSWHGPCVCAGRGGGGGGSLPRWLGALETGKWPRTEAWAAPQAEDRHGSRISQTHVSAPALKHISRQGSENDLTQRNRPHPPRFPEPPSAPGPDCLLLLLAPCPSHGLLGPTKRGPPCRPGHWWAQRKAPVPPSWRVACSRGPPWQAPGAQPPALLLNTGPGLVAS